MHFLDDQDTAPFENLLMRWRQILCEPQVEAGVFYLVGTPIGNLGDLSPRAMAVLMQVDLIFAEDTRHSQHLFQGFGLTAPRMQSCYSQVEAQRTQKLLDALAQGQSVAFMSDAGMPLISDPGAKLAQAAREAGHKVTCIPGPTAAMTALVLSGQDASDVRFCGFLPAKHGRKRQVQNVLAREETQIIYETAKRLPELMRLFYDLGAPKRRVALARELTKRYEEVEALSVEAWLDRFEVTPPRGEYVLVLEGKSSIEAESESEETTSSKDEQIEAWLLDRCVKGIKTKQLAKQAAEHFAECAYSPKHWYNKILELKSKHQLN